MVIEDARFTLNTISDIPGFLGAIVKVWVTGEPMFPTVLPMDVSATVTVREDPSLFRPICRRTG